MNRSSQYNRGQDNKLLIFAGCTLILLLVIGAFQPAQAQDQSAGSVERVSIEIGSNEPDGSQGETVMHQMLRPNNLYGLIASGTGALVLGISLMILSRLRA